MGGAISIDNLLHVSAAGPHALKDKTIKLTVGIHLCWLFLDHLQKSLSLLQNLVTTTSWDKLYIYFILFIMWDRDRRDKLSVTAANPPRCPWSAIVIHTFIHKQNRKGTNAVAATNIKALYFEPLIYNQTLAFLSNLYQCSLVRKRLMQNWIWVNYIKNDKIRIYCFIYNEGWKFTFKKILWAVRPLSCYRVGPALLHPYFAWFLQVIGIDLVLIFSKNTLANIKMLAQSYKGFAFGL